VSFHYITEQFKSHTVTVISLAIAFTALTYSIWREELSERNRNARMASFEALKHLGELQIIVNYAYYQPDDQLGNPFYGWGHMALIGDMAALLPPEASEPVKKLSETWASNWKLLKTDEKAVDQISHDIDQSRTAILELVRKLN
jgi:hypothetical protein